MRRKVKFVLSDMHLGAGYAGEKGNHLESFTADQQFIDFLHQVANESERDRLEVELILNGDFFDFLQVPAVDEYNPIERYAQELYLDSSEKASIKRLNLIIRGHQRVFDALSDFMHTEAPKRRITLIKGNHDVNFFWPGVKGYLREELGASGSRASLLLFAAEFVSREKIYVEHGHQRVEPINHFQDFHDPRLPDNPAQINYPPGSHFMINYLNDLKRDYWFVDGVKPITTLIWYALQWDFDFAARLLSNFIQCSSPIMTDNQSDSQTILQELAGCETYHQFSYQYQNDDLFREQFHQQLHQFLSHIYFTVSDNGSGPLQVDDPLAMGQAIQEYHRLMLQQAAEDISQQEGAGVVLFGHTHHPIQKKLSNGRTYINTGSWIRGQDLLDSSGIEAWTSIFKGTHPLTPHKIPDYLPYARIDYTDDEEDYPTAQLLDFAYQNQDTPAPTQNLKKPISSRLRSWLSNFF